jgi:hypothetical protein
MTQDWSPLKDGMRVKLSIDALASGPTVCSGAHDG